MVFSYVYNPPPLNVESCWFMDYVYYTDSELAIQEKIHISNKHAPKTKKYGI